MKTLVFVLSIVVSFGAIAQYNLQNLRLDESQSGRLTFENLRIYPIRANHKFLEVHRNVGDYKTLKEALGEQRINVAEVGDGSVNELYIENTSSDTLIILAGEVVQGGKQDRMIAQDIILPPGIGKKRVDVFCVEQGRWSSQKGDMNFKSYVTISAPEVRKAGVVEKDQSKVWKKVAETTAKNDAHTSTGTLAALQHSEDYTRRLKSYSDHFSGLMNDADVIGMVAVSGNRVLGCDMFATHDIFVKHYSSLLNSYATEAITNGGAVTITEEAVREYLQAILTDESVQEKRLEENGTVLKNGKRKIHLSSF